MPFHIGTAWFCPACPALAVIGGIDGLTAGTGIMIQHFIKPLLVSNLLDPFLGLPSLKSVGPFLLKCPQFLAGIFLAFPAEIYALFCGTSHHFAFVFTEIAPLSRPASMTFPHLGPGAIMVRNDFEPIGIFSRTDIDRTRGAEQPANGRQFLLCLKIIFPLHHCPPQHFLCFFPLPQGQGSFRPIFFSALTGLGVFNNVSRSAISSGSSGASAITNVQSFSSNMEETSFNRSSVCTRTTAGFFFVPSFVVFFPSNIFSISSPLHVLRHPFAAYSSQYPVPDPNVNDSYASLFPLGMTTMLSFIYSRNIVSYPKTLARMQSQGLFCCCILDRPSLTVDRSF